VTARHTLRTLRTNGREGLERQEGLNFNSEVYGLGLKVAKVEGLKPKDE
jgi:hypothetical protein